MNFCQAGFAYARACKCDAKPWDWAKAPPWRHGTGVRTLSMRHACPLFLESLWKSNSSWNKAKDPLDQTNLHVLRSVRQQSLLIGTCIQTQAGFHIRLGLGNDVSPDHQRKLNRARKISQLLHKLNYGDLKFVLQNFLCLSGVSIYM